MATPGRADAIDIEGRFLVRILAIAQALAQQAAKGAAARRLLVAVLGQLAGEPVGHRGVIGGGAGKGALGQLAAQRQRGGAVVGRHLVQHGFVILDIHHHRHPVMVLGGGAGHGRAADIDILDGGFEIGAARHRGLEGIEIADQKIDACDAMLLHRRGMIGLVAQRQQPAMHIGMQGLDPAIHHFGKVGDLGHIADRQARIAQRLGGAAGGDQHHALAGQALGEFDQAGLVGNRQQGAGNLADGHGSDSRAGGARRSYRLQTNIKGPGRHLRTATIAPGHVMCWLPR